MDYYLQMGIKKLLVHKYLIVQAVLYSAIITWASLARFVNPIGLDIEGGDKIAHFGAYFVFANIWFLLFFFSEKLNKNFRQSIVRASLICFFYGILMEMLQNFLTNYRSSEWYDVLANTSGIIFAVLFLKVFENKLVRFKKS